MRIKLAHFQPVNKIRNWKQNFYLLVKCKITLVLTLHHINTGALFQVSITIYPALT